MLDSLSSCPFSLVIRRARKRLSGNLRLDICLTNSGAEISRQLCFNPSTRQPSLSHASNTLPVSTHSSTSAWPCGTLSSCGSVVRSQGQSLDLRWVGRVSQPLSGAILQASKTFDNTQPSTLIHQTDLPTPLTGWVAFALKTC